MGTLEILAALADCLIWALKVLGGALVLAMAAGVIIVAVAIAREVAWVLRHENRRGKDPGNKQKEEKKK